MNQKALVAGSRLLDLRARRLENGYLEVMAATNAGNFALRRNNLTSLGDSGLSDRLESTLPSAYSGAAIQEVWTDGDSLFVLLDRGRCIVYEYVLPDATGVMEALSFVDDPGTVGRVRKDLEQDRDARRIP
jgi:hypothetical protein